MVLQSKYLSFVAFLYQNISSGTIFRDGGKHEKWQEDCIEISGDGVFAFAFFL